MGLIVWALAQAIPVGRFFAMTCTVNKLILLLHETIIITQETMRSNPLLQMLFRNVLKYCNCQVSVYKNKCNLFIGVIDIWQSHVEIEDYSVAYFDRIAAFEAPYH